ncbi:MAG: EamA family transporter RarD [Desulfomonilaceae bacterium]
MNKGFWYAVGAYSIWGLLPVYLKLLQHVPALQIVSHRILWCSLVVCGAIVLSRQWAAFREALLAPSVVKVYIAAALLIAINWSVYVWAVNSGFVVEASLGYFINPLVSVFLGVVLLHERLRQWQWVAIGFATAGVLYLALAYGRLPWIALTLAFTFAFYGLVKKIGPLGSLFGLMLETGILAAPSLICLLYFDTIGQGAFLHTGAVTDMLLVGTGLVTAVPLLMFAKAARRIPLSLLGILQYIAPTLQFLLGVIVYQEPFSQSQLIGFSFVWAGLVIFGTGGFFVGKAQRD